jgi:hypothetical protein
MSQVLGTVYRVIATHLIKKVGFKKKAAQARRIAWTTTKRAGSALTIVVSPHIAQIKRAKPVYPL